MAKRNEPFPVMFPVKGLHEGVGYDIQPAGTATDALNVRGYDHLQKRLRGGRRAGSSKYYANAVNGTNVIQTMVKSVQSTAYVSQSIDAGPIFAIDDNFLGYAATSPTYLGVNWVYQTCGVTSANNNWNNSKPPENWGRDANGLNLDKILNEAQNRYQLVPCRYPGPNNVSLTMRARPSATTANSNTGAADDAQCFGPFIRGDAALGSFVFACLIRSTADTLVKLQIIFKGLTSETVIATTGDITLSGGAINNNLQIILSEDLATNVLTARLLWPGSGAAGADIDQTLTTSGPEITSNVGKRRWGLGVYTRAQLNLAPGTKFRTFRRVVANAYSDSNAAPLAWTFANTDAGLNRYIIPSGITAQRIQTGGTNFTQVGPFDSAVPPANSVPALDTTSDQFLSVNTNATVHRAWFCRTSPLLGGGPFDPEFTVRSGITLSDTPVVCGMRFDAAFSNGWDIEFVIEKPSIASYSTVNVTDLNAINIRKWVAGNALAAVLNLAKTFPIHKDSRIGVLDNGSTFRFYIDNNILDDSYSTTDYNTQNVTFIGAADNDGAGSDGSYISQMRWRQRSASSSETLPIGSTSSAKLVLASGGSIYGLSQNLLQIAVNGASAMTAERNQIMMQSAFQRTFMLDGTRSKQWNQADNTVSTWTASSGVLPVGGRLITLWRGRMVIAGVVTDPHNWFMSKLGDAFDWNYSPAVTTVIQAVAGNNADAGLVGDIITALIPFTDDQLIFGGDHTIYRMTGDPAAGGTIDLVSDQTGIAFGKAWAKSPDGTLFFWGTDGIYRMAPGGGMENISKGRIDSRYRSVDPAFNRVFMEWNYQEACLYILIVPSNIATATRMLVWDSRADAWWEDAYPASQGPNCMLAFDSGYLTETAFLLGGRDSFVRKVDETPNLGDDGVAITSRVRIAPMIVDNHAAELVVNDVMAVLAKNSGPAFLDIYTGQSAEECQTATTPKVHRLLAHAGRNASTRRRVRGYATQLALSANSTTSWALEGLTVAFGNSGRPRKEVAIGG